MSNYYPDRFVLVEIKGTDPHYRVFGTWYGGYLDGDSWRLNSGISNVFEEDDYYVFEGFTGSSYHCRKGSYGATAYTAGVVENYESQSQGTFTVMEEPEDILKFFENNPLLLSKNKV